MHFTLFSLAVPCICSYYLYQQTCITLLRFIANFAVQVWLDSGFKQYGSTKKSKVHFANYCVWSNIFQINIFYYVYAWPFIIHRCQMVEKTSSFILTLGHTMKYQKRLTLCMCTTSIEQTDQSL